MKIRVHKPPLTNEKWRGLNYLEIPTIFWEYLLFLPSHDFLENFPK